MDLYKGKIPIIYNSLNEGWMRGASQLDIAVATTGCVPRDYSVDPVEMRDSPASMTLFEESEWDAIYDERQKNESGMEHIILRAIDRGEFFFLDQARFLDCWTHSTAHAIMLDALKKNLPMPKLNAVTVATMLNRTNGGWCGLSFKFARDNGFPIVSADAPYQSRSWRDTPAFRESMKQHRVLEDWYDLGRAVYDQKMTKKQLATASFNNCPSPSDYNREAHSMCTVDWVRTERGVWGPLTLNSWKSFGYHGLCVLAGWVPDNACSLRDAA